KVEETRVARRSDRLDRGNPVHMALDEMSAQSITYAERTLEVHTGAGVPSADRRAVERRGHRGYGKPLRTVLANRETGAVHGDALAGRHVAVPALDAELAPRVGGRHAGDAPDVVDQAGEH